MTIKVTAADFEDAVKRYLSGEQTQREAAASIGLSQPAFSSRLRRNGFQTLTRGEAMERRLARMSPAERQALSAAAHEAVRGMVRTPEDLGRRALGKQRTAAHATEEELSIGRELARLGVETIPQQAVGKYNLDLGCSPVAVELFGGAWHMHGEHWARLPQRVEDLADAGWNLLIVWTHTVHPLSVSAVAKDAAAYFQLSSRDPAFRRQYRVIWGDGQFIAAGCADDDKLTLVPSGIRGTYARRG